MTYWRATVERPDGAGGWTTVGVFGTPENASRGAGRYLHGDTPLDAAKLLLRHAWPVDIQEFNDRKDDRKWADDAKAKTGIADHRITIDIDESNRWAAPPGPLPEPLTVTVAELRLAEVQAETAAHAEARAKLEELNKQVRRLRGDVRHGKWRISQAKEEAVRAGVPTADITKASRYRRSAPKRVTS